MIIEAPQDVRDRIIDRMIGDCAQGWPPAYNLMRWVLGLDECSLAFLREQSICECGGEP